MARRLRVMGFTRRPALSKSLQQQLAGMDWVEWLGVQQQLGALGSSIREETVDVVLLDWQQSEEEVLGWLKQYALDPDCNFVAILLHQNESAEQLMKAVRFGAREVIDYPACAELLELALLRLNNLLDRVVQQSPVAAASNAASLPPEAFRQPCKLISVFAAKGGSGASSVAVNLAHELKVLTRQSVLLLDMDQVFNNTALMLNMKPSHALGDLVSRAVNELTDETLEKIILNHESGLNLLAASKSILDDNDLLPPEHLQRVLQFARNKYAYIVVDLPSHALDPYHQFFVEQSDDLLVVSGLDVPGLVRTRQYLDLATQFMSDGKMKLVLNRWDLQAAYGMTNKSLEEEFRYPVFARLNNDWAINVEANSLGKPFSQVKSGSELVKSFKEMARKLAGLEIDEEEEARQAKKTRNLGGFLSAFFTKKEA